MEGNNRTINIYIDNSLVGEMMMHPVPRERERHDQKSQHTEGNNRTINIYIDNSLVGEISILYIL